MTNPINAHCKRLLEELRKEKAMHPQGHDSGDEDPNAWSEQCDSR